MPEKRNAHPETFYGIFMTVMARITGIFSLKKLLRLPKTELIWLAAIFLLPVTYLPAAYTSFELPKVVFFRAVTALLLVSWLFSLRKKKSLKIPRLKSIKWPLILLAAVILTWIISTIFAVAPAVSMFGFYPRFQGLYTWLTVIIFAAVIFLSIENRQQIERIFTAITASAFAVCVLAILQSYGLAWLNYWDVSTFLGRYFGTMGHPDYLASYLVCVMPVAVTNILRNRQKVFSAVTLSFALAVLYLTLSRSAYLGLFAGLLLFILITAKKNGFRNFYRIALAIPLTLISVFALTQVFAQSELVSNNALLSRLTLQGENLRSIETRLALWPATVKQILISPYVGFGMDSFALTFPAFAPAELNTLENLGDYSDRAHNFLLDYAQQFGLPALALFLFFLGLIFASGIKNIFKKVENTHGMADSWLAELALLSGLTALFIANLFGFFVTVTWVYFWLFAALLLRMRAGAGAGAARETPHAREVSTQFLSRKYAGTLFITIVIIAVIPPVMLNDMNLLRSDIAYRESAVDLLGDPGKLFEAATVSPEMSLYSIAAADANTAAAQYFAQQAGKITAYDGVYEFTAAKLFASKKSTKIGGLDATIAGVHFENALQKMPNHPFVYLEYGRYLLANNQPAKAAAMFEKMLSITPDYYSWRDGLETKTPAEQEKYRIFYKLNPDFNKVFELLTDAERKAGNPEKARYYEQYLYY